MIGNKNGPERTILALCLASGTIAITYEVLWTRQLLNLFGSTTSATASMLAAFMAGMAFGSWAMGRWSATINRPLMVYAAIEIALASYGMAFAWIVEFAGGILPTTMAIETIGLGTTLPFRIAINFALLVLPTALMGATLPVLAAAVQTYGGSRPRSLAQTYGLNTLGGVLGAFLTGFWLLETIGLAKAQFVASAAAALVAFTAYTIDRRLLRLPQQSIKPDDGYAQTEVTALSGWVLKGALFLSGCAAIGYEVVWTRILVLVMGSSTYAFSLMLGTYLLGLATGGLWVARHLDQLKFPGTALRHLQLAVAVSALGGVAVFPYLPVFALAGIAGLGTSVWGLATVNAAITIILVLVPTFFLGAALPVGARLLQHGPPRRGRELGDAVALVSVGHVSGVLLTAFVFIPLVGLQGSVSTLAGLNAAAAMLLWLGARSARGLAVPVGVAALVTIGWFLPPWDVNIMTSGVYRQAPAYINLLGSWRGLERAFAQYRTLFYREGREAVVAVFERPTLSADPHVVLALDGKVDASTGADMATQVLSGHLPSLYVPDARRTLVVGLASGVTIGSLLRHPLTDVDVVEIERAVAEASRSFDPYSGAPLDDPRVNLIVEDGRHYLRTTNKFYDVIISEPSNPWLSSSARLYTREFFRLTRERLSPEGVFLQWVPLYGLDKMQFQILLRTIVDVFPEISVFLAAESDLLIVAGERRLNLSSKNLTRLFNRPNVREDLGRAGIHTAPELATRWVADRNGVVATIGEGLLNTDDNGLIEFGSPWYVLRDTRDDNLATIARATATGSFSRSLAQIWNGKDAAQAIDRVARLHLAAGRAGLVRNLVRHLELIDKDASDLLRGDLAAQEKDWATATRIWNSLSTQAAWLRIADWNFQNGKFQDAARYYARVKSELRSSNATLSYGLTLISLNRDGDAISTLSQLSPDNETIAGLLAPLLRAFAHGRLSQPQESEAERLVFSSALDRLRGRLERELDQEILDGLVAWIKNNQAVLPTALRAELQETLYNRIMGPLPNYYRGVRLFWLGVHDDASNALDSYLRMLPENSETSHAKELLQRVRKMKQVD